jgi:hypothetical protein
MMSVTYSRSNVTIGKASYVGDISISHIVTKLMARDVSNIKHVTCCGNRDGL